MYKYKTFLVILLLYLLTPLQAELVQYTSFIILPYFDGSSKCFYSALLDPSRGGSS